MRRKFAARPRAPGGPEGAENGGGRSSSSRSAKGSSGTEFIKDFPSLDASITKMAREGLAEILPGDRIKLTDRGIEEAEALALSMIERFNGIEDSKGLPFSIAEALRKHGIEALACLGCSLHLVPIANGMVWELRFLFLGGNRDLHEKAKALFERIGSGKG